MLRSRMGVIRSLIWVLRVLFSNHYPSGVCCVLCAGHLSLDSALEAARFPERLWLSCAAFVLASPSPPALEAWGRLLSPAMSATPVFDRDPDLSRLSPPIRRVPGRLRVSKCVLPPYRTCSMPPRAQKTTEFDARNCRATIFPSSHWGSQRARNRTGR
jgi:hypothetical protein